MAYYTKTVWANGSVPAINATNLNKIEQGVADAAQKPSLLVANTTWADTDLILVEDGTGPKKMTVASLKSLLGASLSPSGTFTPVIGLGGGALTVAYSVRNATYTKVGNRVTITVHIATSTWTHALTAQILTIGGLPFAPSTVPAQKVMFAGGLFPYVKAGAFGLKPMVSTTVYSDQILFLAELANGVVDFATATYLPSGTQFELLISGSYITG